MTPEEKAESLAKGGLHGLSNETLAATEKLGKRTPIIVTDVPADFDPQKGLTEE